MSYVDAFYDRDQDLIRVVERKNDKREFRDYSPRHIFYYKDPNGKYTSIHGESLSRVSAKNIKELRKELAIHSNKKLYESDINPIYRCLEDNYLNIDAPKLNVAFFDIEVDFDPERGYASPEDAFMPITSIAVELQWMKELICLAIPPKTLSMEQAQKEIEGIPNTILFENEADLLDAFLDIIQDADVLSGWNSEGFDIPYTVNRVTKVLSKEDTRRFCLWDQYPKKREYEKFGKTSQTYDLIGRVHVDSLELYRKYNYEERHTYRLDAIGELEVGETKTVYEGSLDALYNNDFRKFIEYNRQDTALLGKLDQKLKFLDLANTIAHENTVLISTTMGAVAVTEQGIINEAHRRGFIVPNRVKREPGSEPAAGAYVAYPKKGIHEWIGSVDLNSLYPSVIRALNMGPETVVGQLRQDGTKAHIDSQMAKGKSFANAWEGMFGSVEYTSVMEQEVGREITIDWENGDSDTLSSAQIYDLIFESNQPWMLSANGTIFTYEKEGIIPGLLTRWYKERKEMQAKQKESQNAGNKIEEEYWAKRQLVKKINLNSLYGAILNPGCRFFDNRIGQSVTLTGRSITKHMAGKINEIITGEYNHTGKAIVYGDTDSCYFSAYSTLKQDIEKGKIAWTKDSVVELYDTIGETTNETFPKFMQDAFHCPKKRSDGVIAAGREIVASKGLFITKKRYAVLYYDIEGFRTDTEGKSGKIKAMGLDLKRSDTPVVIQEFLSKVLEQVLEGQQKERVLDYITEFRTEFKARPGWEKGSPKRANKITEYEAKEKKQGKANMPGHVRASINWNTLKRMHGDKYSMNITDGAKVIVCKVKDNPMGYTSVAYPVDELRLPEWFKDLPFDDAQMENSVIDEKLGNLIGVLEWDISQTRNDNNFNKLFDFE